MEYIPRLLGTAIASSLRELPVVVLTGARQTGKTTLVRNLPPAEPRRFVTLDDLRALDLAQREPDVLVRAEEPLTLDEVQRVPDLLRAIKREVDRARRPGRFLLTGSANLLLMKTVSETLAGRAVYLRLVGLSEAEKRGAPPPPWGALLEAADPEEARRILVKAGHAGAPAWTSAACEGGYPPVLGLSIEARARWFESYVATYLERDLQQLADISALADFRRLLEAAALRLGGLLNRADLARDAGLSPATAGRWLDLLEVSFQVRLVRAYARGRAARLIKAPKLYFSDTGLAAQLAGLGLRADLEASPRRGALLENLLLCQLDAWRETLAPRPEIYHWRSAAGAEVDFVIEHRRRLLPIEVKASRQVRAADAAGLERMMVDAPGARWGILAYGGEELGLVSGRVLAVPVDRLL